MLAKACVNLVAPMAKKRFFLGWRIARPQFIKASCAGSKLFFPCARLSPGRRPQRRVFHETVKFQAQDIAVCQFRRNNNMQDSPPQFSRFTYRASAVLIQLPYLYEVTLIDISEHGALVGPKQNVEIRMGDEIRLRVLTEKGNQAFEVGVVVAHRSEQGIGLEINSIDRHARSALHRLIETNPGSLDLASRTLPVLLEANFCVPADGREKCHQNDMAA